MRGSAFAGVAVAGGGGRQGSRGAELGAASARCSPFLLCGSRLEGAPDPGAFVCKFPTGAKQLSTI